MPADHPTPDWLLVLEGTPYQRGLVHGETLKSQILDLVGLWKADLGRVYQVEAEEIIRQFLQKTDYVAAMQRWTPDLLDEIKGIADGSGLDHDTILAFQFMDEFWLNAQAITNEHCSSLGLCASDGEPAYIAQNMDLETFRNGYQMVFHIIHPHSDLQVFVLSCAGLIGLNGMNSRSVGICCNSLPQLEFARSGLPVACVVRGVLERQTVDEAITFLQSVRHASGQNYVLGGPQKVQDFECSANQIIPFQPGGREDVIWHTNHPLANDDYAPWYRSALEQRENTDENSVARLQCLQTRLKTPASGMRLDHIKAILSSRDSTEHPVSVPIHGNNPGEAGFFTLASTIMELGEHPRLHIALGPPHPEAYQELCFDIQQPGGVKSRQNSP